MPDVQGQVECGGWIIKADLSMGLLIRVLKVNLLHAGTKAKTQQSIDCTGVPSRTQKTEVITLSRSLFVEANINYVTVTDQPVWGCIIGKMCY